MISFWSNDQHCYSFFTIWLLSYFYLTIQHQSLWLTNPFLDRTICGFFQIKQRIMIIPWSFAWISSVAEICFFFTQMHLLSWALCQCDPLCTVFIQSKGLLYALSLSNHKAIYYEILCIDPPKWSYSWSGNLRDSFISSLSSTSSTYDCPCLIHVVINENTKSTMPTTSIHLLSILMEAQSSVLFLLGSKKKLFYNLQN